MTDVYEEFIVYELDNSGERNKIDIKQEELKNHLTPEQVFLIIREDLRRIYIWKGAKSPVRKRFISSRVAQELQRELMEDSRYHRCKVVSIDQGDELEEFLNAFRLESMVVTEKLPDLRYVRNIERDRLIELGHQPEGGKPAKRDVEEEYYSPILDDKTDNVVMSSLAVGTPQLKGKERPIRPSKVKGTLGLLEEEKEKIKKKILSIEIPGGYERQNLILGHSLYGAVSKVTEVFGKDVVDITWEEVKKVPKGVMELDNNLFRVYFDDKKGIVEAVEVLKKASTPQKKKAGKTASTRKELPKIPSNKD